MNDVRRDARYVGRCASLIKQHSQWRDLSYPEAAPLKNIPYGFRESRFRRQARHPIPKKLIRRRAMRPAASPWRPGVAGILGRGPS